MSVPKFHYISQGQTVQEHLINITSACRAGAELVQLRLKNISRSQVVYAAIQARKITEEFQSRLIINDHYRIAKEVRADGVHLGKLDTSAEIARRHLGSSCWVGATANTLVDCLELSDQPVDYIGLGPFRYTATKKILSTTLGWNGYSRILKARVTQKPIIAIGGIVLSDVIKLQQLGVYGVAVSGAVTGDFEHIRDFNDVLQGDVGELKRRNESKNNHDR